MMNEITELLEKAYAARDLYIIGEITREEALEDRKSTRLNSSH